MRDASADGPLPDPRVARCIARALERVSFPRPTGGTVEIRYPLRLTPRLVSGTRRNALTGRWGRG